MKLVRKQERLFFLAIVATIAAATFVIVTAQNLKETRLSTSNAAPLEPDTDLNKYPNY